MDVRESSGSSGDSFSAFADKQEKKPSTLSSKIAQKLFGSKSIEGEYAGQRFVVKTRASFRVGQAPIRYLAKKNIPLKQLFSCFSAALRLF